MATSGLVVAGVSVAYAGRQVLDAVSLRVAPDEVVALLGPSGSGKSTLLAAIAGVGPMDGGRIRFDGEDLTAVPPHRRGIGLVFQDPLLFPHLDVAGNVGFGPRVQRRSAAVDELLTLVGLPGFGGRAVATLSGGEAQRVALARALAAEPRVLLMDEPFGALDRPLRLRLGADVAALLRARGVAGLLVTHDEAEAEAVADRVLRLEDLQGGEPADRPV